MDELVGPARQPVTMKYRRSTLRAITEICDLMGGISRESLVQIMLLDGITAAYKRLGIEDEPAVVASRMLAAVADSWASDLTREELGAIGMVQLALRRITELNAKDTASQDLPEAPDQDRLAGNSPA